MCNDIEIIEQSKPWVFVFGSSHKYYKKYIILNGTFKSTREKMYELFDGKWSYQFSNLEKAEITKYNLTELKLIDIH
jgi:hypothetical protein